MSWPIFRPLNERCLPLLKQYSSECLDAFGLNMVCQAWEQRVVPASVVACLSMGNGLYVIGGCRPSNADVELVVHAGSNIWSHHVSQCQPCKFPENRHVEGLFGCNYGYLCVFRLSVHHVLRQVWVNGFSVPFVVQNLEDAPYLDQIDDLLHLCQLIHLPLGQLPDLMDNSLFALSCRLRDSLRNDSDWPVFIAQNELFGYQPLTPKVTLVIPLYRVWHVLMQGHLAAFSLDPLVCSDDVEILYVVDDPSIEDDVVRWLRNHSSYLPFSIRVICLHQNMGFGMACNIGVQAARSDVVVLMNSDVFPLSKGWIDVLCARLQADPDALVAPMLLYGALLAFWDACDLMAFKESNSCNCTLKGRSSQLRLDDALDGIQEPQAISGAVLAFQRDTFLHAGGFDPIFGRGDFEDLELSLRWKRLSGPLFQVRSTSLCHLERQSMNVVESDLKEWRARFNALCAMRLCPELSEGIHP